MKCQHHHADVECVQLTANTAPLMWSCPVLAKRMTKHWTDLCRQPDGEHFRLWFDSPPAECKTWVPTPELIAAAERLAEDSSEPSIIEKIVNYRRALMRWKKRGFPTRSDAEVAQIHETHCVPCEMYNADRQVCTKCGCGVHQSGLAVFSKLRMATERCPLGEWT